LLTAFCRYGDNAGKRSGKAAEVTLAQHLYIADEGGQGTARGPARRRLIGVSRE
jgi:hypothetical protein